MAAAQSVAAAAASAVNSALKVHSPSKLMIETGEFTGEGLALGLENMRGAVENAAKASMAQPVIDGASQFRTIETPEFSRTGVIADTIGSFSGSGSGAAQSQPAESPVSIVFSPTYNFSGDAPSKQDIVEANRMSQSEFEKMMKEYLRKNKRVAFA